MRSSLLLSAAVHVALVTFGALLGWQAVDAALRPTVRWLPHEEQVALPEDPPADPVVVEEPELAEPMPIEPPVIAEELVFEEPEEILPPLDPLPRRDSESWHKLALTRVVPRRRPPAMEVIDLGAPAIKPSVRKPEAAPFVAPSPLADENEPPRYPPLARRRGQQGEVALNVLVGSDGRVKSVEILKSSGYSVLDEEAKRAVSKWTFSPATRGAGAIDAWFPLSVVFRLRGDE